VKSSWIKIAGLFGVFALTACVSKDSRLYDQDPDDIEVIEKLENSISNSVIETTFNEIDTAALPAPDDADVSFADDPDIPDDMKNKVDAWVEYFSVKDRDRFQRFIGRGGKFKGMIQSVLREQGVPTDIFYLAMIESGFSVRAKSHASAVGVWQFISGTGRRYGLRIDNYVDERRDAMRATVAASMYLKDLHNVFNSWYLAMAAYNSGENRVLRAIMKHNTRDFWKLVRLKGLPKETMNYIPKVIAASRIGHNMDRYGFEPGVERYPTLKAISVPSPVKLSEISKRSGISVSILKKYNPNIKKSMTPPGAKTYKFWVPIQHEKKMMASLASLSTKKIKGLRYSRTASKSSVHKVRRGESLSTIASKYRITVRTLKANNKLRSNRIYAGQRLKIYSKKVAASSYKRHRVRRGENLSSIAKKFGTSVSKLKKINRIRRTTIYAGQLIKVKEYRR
jgi:membrane-bound lytic murein transglycosylase D